MSARGKWNQYNAFSDFVDEINSQRDVPRRTIEDYRPILEKFRPRFKKDAYLAARAYIASLMGDQELVKELAHKMLSGDPVLAEVAKNWLLDFGERVYPEPEGLHDGPDGFNYALASKKYREAREKGYGKYNSATREAMMDAWPPRFLTAYQSVHERESVDFDPLIDFVEADPIFFRSGYVKEDLLTLFKRRADDLSKKQVRRLQGIILAAANRWATREFPYYVKLARRLADPEFADQLRTLRNSEQCVFRSQIARCLEVVEESLRMQNKA